MPQASSMSDTRGMLQAAPIRIELLIKNEANQNRNKKVSFVLPVGKANFLTQNFPEVKI
jgi:hypothetical protein